MWKCPTLLRFPDFSSNIAIQIIKMVRTTTKVAVSCSSPFIDNLHLSIHLNSLKPNRIRLNCNLTNKRTNLYWTVFELQGNASSLAFEGLAAVAAPWCVFLCNKIYSVWVSDGRFSYGYLVVGHRLIVARMFECCLPRQALVVDEDGTAAGAVGSMQVVLYKKVLLNPLGPRGGSFEPHAWFVCPRHASCV